MSSRKKDARSQENTGRASIRDDERVDPSSGHAARSKRTNAEGGNAAKRLTALEEAQQLMYKAWQTTDPLTRVALAQKALELSSDCADAYVLLGREISTSIADAIALYRLGVEAGERAVGKEAFERDAGRFWEIVETRPYMRARQGLAEFLWGAGHREEAVEHYQDLLRLNPTDNQGIRNLLMPCLIELGRDEDAYALFKRYELDEMAVWKYSRVVLEFRKNGDSPSAGEFLEKALEQNPFVPEYLLGQKAMPHNLPQHFSFGDRNEAIMYVYDNHVVWNKTPGILNWLKARME